MAAEQDSKALQNLCRVMLCMLNDLHNGWPWKELVADISHIREEAKKMNLEEEVPVNMPDPPKKPRLTPTQVKRLKALTKNYTRITAHNAFVTGEVGCNNSNLEKEEVSAFKKLWKYIDKLGKP